jgi:hypothetical protein
MLKDKVFGRRILFVGEDSRLQFELLGNFECIGSRDQVGGEAASQEIARRAGNEKEQSQHRAARFLAHKLGDPEQAGLRPADSRGRLSPHNQHLHRVNISTFNIST